MTLWQPIATAPKDGTEILAITASGRYTIVHWYTHYFEGKVDPYREPNWVDAATFQGGAFHYPHPTHWMPLPPRGTQL